jgi:formylglycine-generating enzyme required for sulfatase activity
MKYEINQGEYATFLNQLPQPHATARYPRPTMPARFLKLDFHTVKKEPGGYVATKPDNSCNWISWADAAAYADWSGMRPMTELEYEKACRGPLDPATNEYAWGNDTLSDTAATRHQDAPLPPYPVGICGQESRTRSGSTYWGIATMTGHLRERVVNIGTPEGRVFTGLCGDGALAADGHANVPTWPAPSSVGAGCRGGPWYKDKVRLRVSDRYLSVCLRPQRADVYGFRGVRQAP